MANQTLQKHYVDPDGPIHILSGAAGAPGLTAFGPKPGFVRKRVMGGSYSRAVFYNASVLRWEQVGNDDGEILDEFHVVKK